MSVATESGPQASRYVDFDEFIDYQLHKAQAGIKTTDLLTALIGGAVALLTYILVFAVFDHWIVEGGFGRTTRLGLLALLAILLTCWCIWKLIIPYSRRVTALYAAREIEEADPEFHNMLLTLVDLQRAGRPVPEQIQSAIEKRAARNLAHIDVEEAIDRRLLMRLSYVLLGLVVATSLYTIFSPKKLSNSLWRALLPTSDVQVDTRTRILRVDPGNVEVLSRAQLPVFVDLSGEAPQETLLLYTTADRRFVDEPLTMREADDGLRRYRTVLTGENGRGILQNLTYRVQAGDAISPVYQVTVKQPPTANVHDVLLEFPKYMGLDSRQQAGGSIDAWEGTWVTVRATANMPIASALVEFRDSEDSELKAEEIPAIVTEGQHVSVRWQLQLRSDGTHPQFYRIQVRNEAGESDPEPTLYSLKIHPDEPPRLVLHHPESDIERPANAVVPLLFEASDPDFLLRTIILRLEQDGIQLTVAPRLYEGPPYQKNVAGTFDFDLSKLPLRPGDRLTYWLEARDNMEPFADRDGNRTNTPRLNIDIMDAVSPEEVEQHLEEEKQRIQEQLQASSAEENVEAMSADQPPSDHADSPVPPPGEEPEGTQPPSQPAQSTDPSTTSGQTSESSGTGARSSPAIADRRPGDPSSPAESPDLQRPEEGSPASEQGDQPFDEMLRRLMEIEQEREAQQGREAPQNASPDRSEDPAPGEDRQGPGSSSASDAQESTQQQPSETASEAGQHAGDASSQSRPGQPSAGEETQPDANPSGPSASRETTGGQPTSDTSEDGTSADKPTGDLAMPEQSPETGTTNERRNGETGRSESTESQPSTDPSSHPSSDPASPESPNARPASEPSESAPALDVAKPPESGTPSPGKAASQPGSNPNGEQAKQDPAVGPRPSEQSGGQTPPDSTSQAPAKTGSQPTGPDDPLRGEGRPNGQRADQPQSGEGGSSQQASEGTPSNDATGAGAPSGTEGDQAPAGQPSGKPGQQAGEGSQQGAGGEGGRNGGEGESAEDSQEQPSNRPEELGENTPPPDDGGMSEPKGSDGAPQGGGQQGGEGGAGGASGGGQSAEQGGGSPQQGGGHGGGGVPGPGDAAPRSATGGGSGQPAPEEGGSGTGGESGTMTPEEADLENKRKAANLVLQRLREQLERGEMDAQWRERLGVTEEQLQEFGRRLQERLADEGDDLSPEAEARRRQFEETLRTIDFRSRGSARAGGDAPREAASGFGSSRRIAPPKHRDAAEAYRQMLSRKQNAPTPSGE